MITSTSVWYLSHPVAPDEHYTYEQNLSHTLHMMKLCWDEGFRVYAPWHTLCLIIPDANPEYRKMGLEVDCALAKMTGRMILTGHKISSGMNQELVALMTAPNPYWIDVTGLHDKKVCDLLRARRKELWTPPTLETSRDEQR